MSSPSPETNAANRDRPRRGRPPKRPVALSIAGSDSGGGAGIQADLAAFSYFRVFGTTALTAVTAQNPTAVTGICPVDEKTVRAQIEAVFQAFDVGAVKTGMLFSAAIIHTVAACLGSRQHVPVVVDPVMVATSGARLLRDDAVQELVSSLLPLASIITPNLPEAAILCGHALDTDGAICKAAAGLAEQFRAVAVIKGGHAASGEAVDVVSDGRHTWTMAAPRMSSPTTHGTGCSLSAAIAACLAGNEPVNRALRRAKAYVLGRLRTCVRVGADTYAMAPPERLPTRSVKIREVPAMGKA